MENSEAQNIKNFFTSKSLAHNIYCGLNSVVRNAVLLKPQTVGVQIVQKRQKTVCVSHHIALAGDRGGLANVVLTVYQQKIHSKP